ncbi:uncharacterized protein ova [Drosophila virilis]|uniref:uncharacterized protein ova n=1 Tax=Drosophila virilis TaxID=7244 RepID=UPI001395D337|nr:uncharacterized protein LOC6627422 isoform X2 [Drosophila virilis]XP_032293885.1 uncharacterized protein LOC6627422 isoform X2 [Drosophila virilis]XP_032293886.1 uncharacterized protein LOC6627422 isoform X2 [Drosophila virilis]XP_032293887.1 uncharacterized protein LOC6627422 isoform X2 [Drosophila virilis]XP_032293888.1 uncharacterized protein LOC6627422 isoform X2 [Drosophila virilis]
MDESDKSQQNMISNLPLLFANGYPTSLEKITESQLENFIPFMVQCSLGHINLPKKIDCSEPEWWPENASFGIPLKRPKHFVGNWMEKMKEIVVICYQFHKSLFLLRFCNDLAAYEHASLRFINNYNSTTSLYDRRNNKLLVTFRNENMSYDRQHKNRKCLLLHKNKTDVHGEDSHYMMVEPPPFDIYLCDNCDAELYSTEAILEHEKICNMEDDVILCDSPEPDSKIDTKNENIELRNAFLLNFCLQSKATNYNNSKKTQGTNSYSEELVTMTSNRNRRISARRNRAVPSLNRCSFIPISSPAGQKLLSSIKQTISMEYVFERQERLDRFCYTPLLLKSSCKHKFFEKKNCTNNIHITFKKMQDFSSHIYAFPRRQFLQRRDITQNFLFLNSPLIKKCRPISVRLKKLTDNIGDQFPISNTKLNIRLTRDTSLNSQWRISPSTEVVVDTIDLCSSDDDDPSSDRSKFINRDTLTIMSLSHNKEVAARQNNHIGESEWTSLAGYSQSTGDNSLKPLKQSVYIFSNYKTNSVLNTFSLESKANSSEKALSPSSNFSHSYNQENCDLSKRIVTVPDWCAASSEKSGINQTDTIDFENLSTVQPFNSSGRVISIDLTT